MAVMDWVRGVLVAGGLSVICPASVQAQTFADIEYWVGSGENSAALVIDWNDGKDDQSLLWGFRWDGSATGEDMLRAVIAADARLFAHFSDPVGGAMFGAGYDLDNDGSFGVSPSLVFSNGASVGTASDGRMPADPADHWQEGWFSDGFWSYWDGGTESTPNWDFAPAGMDLRPLVDGAWDGWSYAPGFDGFAPSEPVPAQVPSPGAVALVGFATLASRRRCRTV